jgi:hypothetical protein
MTVAEALNDIGFCVTLSSLVVRNPGTQRHWASRLQSWINVGSVAIASN